MSTVFWFKRFVTILAAAFIVITSAQLSKGHDLGFSMNQGAIWGGISAAVFTVARYFQARRKQHCAICKDTPEMQ
jgi:hypothetical protein